MNALRPVVFILLMATGAVHPAFAQDTDACISASETAVALRKTEKLVESRVALSVCASSSCPEIVRTSCRERLAEVNLAIPSIVLVAEDERGRDLAEVRLTIDGTASSEPLDGSAIALDPGEHEFRFELAGHRPVRRRLVLHQGEQNRREHVVLPADRPPVGLPAPGRGDAQRAVGLAGGAVGLAALVASAVFGGLSLAAHGDYERNCGLNGGVPPGYCNQKGVDGEHDAANKGTFATVFLATGAVVTATSLVLFVAAPKARTSVQVGVGPGALVLRTGF